MDTGPSCAGNKRIPIEAQYVLRRGHELPPVMFTEAEAIAVGVRLLPHTVSPGYAAAPEFRRVAHRTPEVTPADNPGSLSLENDAAHSASQRSRVPPDFGGHRSEGGNLRGRVGNQPGGGVTLQSGCPDGSAFQNMILSK
jgi:hypothetical protein